MLRHVQCTYPKLSWLFVLVAACSLAACGGSIGGDSVTGSPVSLSASEPELESTFEQAKGGGKHHRRHHDRDDDDDDGDSDDDDDDGERDDRGRRHRDRDDDDDDDDDKVLVCHKDRKNLWVSQRAVRGHMRHGDTLGRCRDGAPSATCPCFSRNNIKAAAQCAGTLNSQCSTGDPAFLFLTCDAGSTGVLGIYASATASGGSCSRDDVHGSVSQNGLTRAEYQACVNVIRASVYCSP